MLSVERAGIRGGGYGRKVRSATRKPGGKPAWPWGADSGSVRPCHFRRAPPRRSSRRVRAAKRWTGALCWPAKGWTWSWRAGRARALLKLYEEENRGWALRVRMPGGEARLHGLALARVLAMAWIHAANGGRAPARAVFDSAAFAHGESWRAWTATWLRADMAHLAMNGVFGGLLMGLAMGRYGPGTALGGAMAALGMLAANALGLWRARRAAARWVLPTLGASAVLFVQVGTSPKGDVVVHALGFLAGIPAGALAALGPARRRTWLDAAGWAVATLTTAWAWGRALGWDR